MLPNSVAIIGQAIAVLSRDDLSNVVIHVMMFSLVGNWFLKLKNACSIFTGEPAKFKIC